MFQHDPQRIAGCVHRLRFSIKLVPWVIVPLTSAISSLPGIAVGLGPMLVFAVIGLIVGFYCSVIVATLLESMAILLISIDCRTVTEPDP